MEKAHIHTDDSSARTDADSTVEKSDVALREEEMLAFWREHDIFNTSVEKEAPNGDFVFYDGPPFATGLPHYGHILAGTIKDAIPRFWTMNGYRVRRTWGWDCHGLPLENLIEKKLGLATKRDIEEYGVKNFNEAARKAVMEYADDWKRIIPRMGRWADMDDDYKTMDSTYTESVWWVFKSLHDKGLVYEGFKSMHLCPRCGTTLSNFEVNQGYKDIKDIAVTVKLPLLGEEGKQTDTSLLVWTTTPWTLPGNMAAAVHKEGMYSKVKVQNENGKDEYVILGKERVDDVLSGMEYEVVEEFRGAELVGRSYTPPFDYWTAQEFEGAENAWKIYHADYVELEGEGTGAVHLAPAYGEEDMELAKAGGVPIVHHVGEDGRFMDFVTDFAGQLVKPKDDDDAGVTHLNADIEIVKKLKELGSLFRKENVTHSYPHCWRCDTPLLNYATTSWFVEVTKFKDQLVSENEKVHWVPEYVGKNRFGRWLEGARDWAISRQRYWGAPLPIWRNPETKEYKVFGSLAELQEHVPKSGNTYLTLRHTESEKNVAGIVTGEYDAPYPLTDKGRADVTAIVQKDLAGGVDLIVTSPVLRAKQTAELVAEKLGLDASQVVVDERVRETAHGGLEGKSLEEYRTCFPQGLNRFTTNPEGIENWTDVKRRVGEFMFDMERSHQGKRILIVSHGDPLGLLHSVTQGLNRDEILAAWDEQYPEKGVVREVSFTLYPHNDDYELDYHRPYIDQIQLYDGDIKLERVLDVFDCWFESGSMPYAQHHYPFEREKAFKKELFPAHFIAEGLDQTRGWFYSLIVLGTALFGKSPYQNVIVNGTILAEDGQKMSKRLQNYPDPMDVAYQYGADAMRFYLLSSSVMRAEDLNFSEKEVAELQRKNIGRLHNVLAMYEMYAPAFTESAVSSFPRMRESSNVLDQWILARLNQLVTESTEGFRNYELDKATRPITDFIDDVSVWYLRRSRERLKSGDDADKQATLATLRHVLKTLALVMAPSMPFYAEYLYGRVREKGDAESVHLANWPEASEIDPVVLGEMSIVREFVGIAFEARAKANIKVRQPLPKLSTNILLEDAYADIVADEVNVKEVVADTSLTERAVLDTTITPELQMEGDARGFIRAVQDMRKQAGLSPEDRITLTVQTQDDGRAIIETFRDTILQTVGAEEITYADTDGEEITAGEYTMTVSLQRVAKSK